MTTQKPPRNSNIELLRLAAMLLVLILHADFMALGQPTAEELADNPGGTLVRIGFETFSIIAVNVFVLISGWFSIKASLRGLFTLLFQCAFFYLAIFGAMYALGYRECEGQSYVRLLSESDNIWWFVRKYLVLYLLSPLLNTVGNKTNRKQLGIIVFSILLLQTVIGFALHAKWYSNGYSATAFIGLYMLARYVRLYADGISRSKAAAIFTACFAANTLFCVMLTGNIYRVDHYALSYLNPLVILQALSLLLITVKTEIGHNRLINYSAKSALAIYLLHQHVLLRPVYYDMIRDIYHTYSSISFCVILCATIAAWFIAGIGTDLLRRYLWDRIIAITPQPIKEFRLPLNLYNP